MVMVVAGQLVVVVLVVLVATAMVVCCLLCPVAGPAGTNIDRQFHAGPTRY